jgi:ATP-dependent Clp protease ATP-binding subunit ClpA
MLDGMFERFTEAARQVVVMAQDEAGALRHNHIGTEHLLLGLLREEEGAAARALATLDISLEEARARVARIVGRGDDVPAGQIPFTPEAKRTLERALREALAVGDDYIGTEHIVAGLLRKPDEIVTRVLQGADIGAIADAALAGKVRKSRWRRRQAVAAATERWEHGVFEKLTERARQVVVLAQDEARALKHNYIGTEHVLLGLLREKDGLAAQALEAVGVFEEEVRAHVARIVGQGDEVTAGPIPFTPRAWKVLELALGEALSLGHNHIGTEHILLGLVRENEGVAARVLLDFDADAERIRNEIIRMLPGPGRQMQAGVHAEHPVRLAIPCPSCGATMEAVVIQPQPGSGFAAQRHGPARCKRCGSEYDIDYSIEWRPT